MKRILPIIVLSQFFCTSLWFAGNATMTDIIKQFHLEPAFLAYLTSAVQAGFITGTLIFAVHSISDRFSPSKLFLICAIIAGVLNMGIIINGINKYELMLFRFMTGFFLAGIYPVGMKIASDHFQQKLGKSLGFLVGALVLGTAFPHFLKSIMANFPWKYVILSTSIFSILGGLTMFLLVPDGPYRNRGQKIKINALAQSFQNRNFRAAAFGYFGHMWELYSFWVFVPVMLTTYNYHYPGTNLNVALLSFLIIVAGSAACVFSGWISEYFGTIKTAIVALSLSCICCIASPLFLFSYSAPILIIFLFIWSMAAIADSPLFSTLVARNAPDVLRGTALTLVNCIGFSITIVSIQLITTVRNESNSRYIYIPLAIGPALGLLALKLKSNTPGDEISASNS